MSGVSAVDVPLDPAAYAVYALNGTLLYQPFAKQLQYHLSPARYPLYGGSKGCGKSKAVRFDHYLPSLAVPGLKSLIVRRKLTELQRSHLRFVPREGEALGAKWKPSDVGAGVLHFPNGSLIEFGHCQHEDDVDQYLSAEYDRISFDELVTFSEYQYLMISSCCRSTIPGVLPRIGGATNPGGPAASWVKRRWVDRDVTADEDPDYRVEDYAYVPALPSDNPYLNWEEYRRILNRLPPELRRAYLEGDWDIFVGQFFPEFRRSWKPDERGQPQAPHVLEDHELERYCGDASLSRRATVDWGYGHEGVVLWSHVDPSDGTLVVDDELVFNGPKRDKYVASEVAQQAIDRGRRRGWTVSRWLGDPKMGDQTGHEGGETILQTWQRYVPLQPADNQRENGWARVRAWLRTNPKTDRPYLRVHPRCGYLIRTLPSLVMEETNLEDLDTDGEDHAADCLRYDVMGRPRPEVEDGTVGYPVGTVGWMRQQLREAEGPRRAILGREAVRRSREYA